MCVSVKRLINREIRASPVVFVLPNQLTESVTQLRTDRKGWLKGKKYWTGWMRESIWCWNLHDEQGDKTDSVAIKVSARPDQRRENQCLETTDKNPQVPIPPRKSPPDNTLLT